MKSVLVSWLKTFLKLILYYVIVLISKCQVDLQAMLCQSLPVIPTEVNSWHVELIMLIQMTTKINFWLLNLVKREDKGKSKLIATIWQSWLELKKRCQALENASCVAKNLSQIWPLSVAPVPVVLCTMSAWWWNCCKLWTSLVQCVVSSSVAHSSTHASTWPLMSLIELTFVSVTQPFLSVFLPHYLRLILSWSTFSLSQSLKENFSSFISNFAACSFCHLCISWQQFSSTSCFRITCKVQLICITLPTVVAWWPFLTHSPRIWWSSMFVRILACSLTLLLAKVVLLTNISFTSSPSGVCTVWWSPEPEFLR